MRSALDRSTQTDSLRYVSLLNCDAPDLRPSMNHCTEHDMPLRLNPAGGGLLPDQLAMKPKFTVPPGGIEAFQDRLVTVTVEPLCTTFPFQSCEMTWPAGNVHFTVQPLMVVVPL